MWSKMTDLAFKPLNFSAVDIELSLPDTSFYHLVTSDVLQTIKGL